VCNLARVLPVRRVWSSNLVVEKDSFGRIRGKIHTGRAG